MDSLAAKFGVELQRLGSLTGAQLVGCQYRHPLFERTSPVLVGGDYITTESGTGLVHTAPGHGQEDYQVSKLCCWRAFIHIQYKKASASAIAIHVSSEELWCSIG